MALSAKLHEGFALPFGPTWVIEEFVERNDGAGNYRICEQLKDCSCRTVEISINVQESNLPRMLLAKGWYRIFKPSFVQPHIALHFRQRRQGKGSFLMALLPILGQALERIEAVNLSRGQTQ